MMEISVKDDPRAYLVSRTSTVIYTAPTVQILRTASDRKNAVVGIIYCVRIVIVIVSLSFDRINGSDISRQDRMFNNYDLAVVVTAVVVVFFHRIVPLPSLNTE